LLWVFVIVILLWGFDIVIFGWGQGLSMFQEGEVGKVLLSMSVVEMEEVEELATVGAETGG
jgi:hypothetical protein